MTLGANDGIVKDSIFYRNMGIELRQFFQPMVLDGLEETDTLCRKIRNRTRGQKQLRNYHLAYACGSGIGFSSGLPPVIEQ